MLRLLLQEIIGNVVLKILFISRNENSVFVHGPQSGSAAEQDWCNKCRICLDTEGVPDWALLLFRSPVCHHSMHFLKRSSQKKAGNLFLQKNIIVPLIL